MWPQTSPQNIHPVEGKAPACEVIVTRMSVTASYGVQARKPADKPSNLDTGGAFLLGRCCGVPGRGGEASRRCPQEERNSPACRVMFKVPSCWGKTCGSETSVYLYMVGFDHVSTRRARRDVIEPNQRKWR